MESWNQQWQAGVYASGSAPAAAAVGPPPTATAVSNLQMYQGMNASQDPSSWSGAQDNWLQWQQWQTQYQQWQAQYGEKYQAALAAGLILPGGALASTAPAVPNVGSAPQPVQPPALPAASASGHSSHHPEEGSTKRALSNDRSSKDVKKSKPSQDAIKADSNQPQEKEGLSENERTFDEQFKRWEEQFQMWKKQNQNHPNKEQYKEYEQKWYTWREQLIQRREQMRKKREKQTSTSTGATDKNKTSMSPQPVNKKVSAPLQPALPSQNAQLPPLPQGPPPPPPPGTPPKLPAGPPPPPPPEEDLMDKPLQFKSKPESQFRTEAKAKEGGIPGLDLLGKTEASSVLPKLPTTDIGHNSLFGIAGATANAPPGFSSSGASFYPAFNSAHAPPGFQPFDSVGNQPWHQSALNSLPDLSQAPPLQPPEPFPSSSLLPPWDDSEVTDPKWPNPNNRRGEAPWGREEPRDREPRGSHRDSFPPLRDTMDAHRSDERGPMDEFRNSRSEFLGPVGPRDTFPRSREPPVDEFRSSRDDVRGGRDRSYPDSRDSDSRFPGNTFGPREENRDSFDPRGDARIGRDDLDQPPLNFRPPPDDLRRPLDDSGKPIDPFEPQSKDFRGPLDDFKGRRESLRGPFFDSPDDFGDRGPRDELRPPPGEFRGHPDDFRSAPPDLRRLPGDFRRPDEFRGSTDDYRPLSDDFRPPFDDFRAPPLDDFRLTRDEFRPPFRDLRLPRDDFRPLREDFRGARDDFRGPRDDFRPHPEDFRGLRGELRGPRDLFRLPPDDFLSPRDDIRRPADDIRGPRPDLRAPFDDFRDFRSPRDEFRVPIDDLRGNRDDFRSPRDEFRSLRDDFRGPRDEFRGPRDEFRGPRDDFRSPRDGFRSPLNDLRTLPDDLRGPPDSRPLPGDTRDTRGLPDSLKGPLGDIRGPPPDLRGPPPDLRGPPPDLRGLPPDVRGPPPDLRGPLADLRGPPPERRSPHEQRSSLPDFRGPPPGLRGPPPLTDLRDPAADLRCPPPDLRGPLPDLRGPLPDLRGPLPDLRGPLPDIRGPPPEFRGPPPEFRGPKRDFKHMPGDFQLGDMKNPAGDGRDFLDDIPSFDKPSDRPPQGESKPDLQSDERGSSNDLPDSKDTRNLSENIKDLHDVEPQQVKPRPLLDDFRAPNNEFRFPRDFRGGRDNFRGPRKDFGGLFEDNAPRDNFRGPRDDFRGPRDDFRAPRNDFRGPRGELRGFGRNFRGGRSEPHPPWDRPREPDDFFRYREGDFHGEHIGSHPDGPREAVRSPLGDRSDSKNFFSPHDESSTPRDEFQFDEENTLESVAEEDTSEQLDSEIAVKSGSGNHLPDVEEHAEQIGSSPEPEDFKETITEETDVHKNLGETDDVSLDSFKNFEEGDKTDEISQPPLDSSTNDPKQEPSNESSSGEPINNNRDDVEPVNNNCDDVAPINNCDDVVGEDPSEDPPKDLGETLKEVPVESHNNKTSRPSLLGDGPRDTHSHSNGSSREGSSPMAPAHRESPVSFGHGYKENPKEHGTLTKHSVGLLGASPRDTLSHMGAGQGRPRETCGLLGDSPRPSTGLLGDSPREKQSMRGVGPRESPSLLGPGPRDNPSLLGTCPRDSPSLLGAGPRESPSLLGSGPREGPSLLGAGPRETPSLLGSGPRESPSLLGAGPRESPSLLGAGPRESPSLLGTGPRESPSLLGAGPREMPSLLGRGPDLRESPSRFIGSHREALLKTPPGKPDNWRMTNDNTRSSMFCDSGKDDKRGQARLPLLDIPGVPHRGFVEDNKQSDFSQEQTFQKNENRGPLLQNLDADRKEGCGRGSPGRSGDRISWNAQDDRKTESELPPFSNNNEEDVSQSMVVKNDLLRKSTNLNFDGQESMEGNRDVKYGSSGEKVDKPGFVGRNRDEFLGPLHREEPPDSTEGPRGPPRPRDDFRGPVGRRDDHRQSPGCQGDLREPLRDDFLGLTRDRDNYRSSIDVRDDDFRGRSHFKGDFLGPSHKRDDFKALRGPKDEFHEPAGFREDARDRDWFCGPQRPREELDFRGPPGFRSDLRQPPKERLYEGEPDELPSRFGARGNRRPDEFKPSFRDDDDNSRGAFGRSFDSFPRDVPFGAKRDGVPDRSESPVLPSKLSDTMTKTDDGKSSLVPDDHRLLRPAAPPDRDWDVRPRYAWNGPPRDVPPLPPPHSSHFALEPTTVVDYGHRPAGGAPTSIPPSFPPAPAPAPAPILEPIQTFDYGHGSGTTSRPSPPRSPGPWRRNAWERERDREERVYRMKRERDRWEEDRYDRRDTDRMRNGSSRWRDREREREREVRRRRPSPLRSPPPAPPPPSVPSLETAAPRPVLIEDVLCPPGRNSRPANLVVILRGPPGSGKSFMAKMIKDKEVEQGGTTPRMLSIDDYFVTEVEKEERDPETGKKVTFKMMEYEYEAIMEKSYQESLFKAFKKTISDGYFNFVIVDAVNNKVAHFEEMWTFAKQKGFQVYICEMDLDTSLCLKRNIHKRSEKDIRDIINKWEETPRNYLRIDPRSMLQSAAIEDVEMQDAGADDENNEEGDENSKTRREEEEDFEEEENVFMSKWEKMESQGEKMDRLDGLAKRRKDGAPQTLEDWLQLPDDYEKKRATPGKKQVRWADLEERRKQEKARAIGFVVGQTDWSRLTDPTFGEGALTQTKYI